MVALDVVNWNPPRRVPVGSEPKAVFNGTLNWSDRQYIEFRTSRQASDSEALESKEGEYENKWE